MLRHNVPCRDSGARHYIATRLCAYERVAQQCGAALRRDKKGHPRAIDESQNSFYF